MQLFRYNYLVGVCMAGAKWILPRSVRVMGKVCKIRKKRGLISGHGALGLFEPSTFEIWIDSTLSPEEQESTFFHELIHALFERLSLGVAGISHDAEEFIAENIYKFIKESNIYELKLIKK